MTRAAIPIVGQRIPEEFAERLRAMRAADDRRLNAVLKTAREKGWTSKALAEALGVSYAAVGRRVARCRHIPADLPDVPPPPRWAGTRDRLVGTEDGER